MSCYSTKEKFSKCMFPLTECLWHKTEKMASFCVIVMISNKCLQTFRSDGTILFSSLAYSFSSNVWCKQKRILNWYLTENSKQQYFHLLACLQVARRHSLWMMSTEFPFKVAKSILDAILSVNWSSRCTASMIRKRGNSTEIVSFLH